MVNILKKINTEENLKLLFSVMLTVFVLIVVPHVLMLLISMILPFIFDMFYILWIQVFHLMLPLIIILSSLLVILLPKGIKQRSESSWTMNLVSQNAYHVVIKGKKNIQVHYQIRYHPTIHWHWWTLFFHSQDPILSCHL